MCRPSMSSQNYVVVIPSVSCLCVMAPSQADLGPHPGPLEEPIVQTTFLPENTRFKNPNHPAPGLNSPYLLPLGMVVASVNECASAKIAEQPRTICSLDLLHSVFC